MTCAIIIPFYQREDGVLRRTLQSVFSQTYQDWRVIIVDDASPHPAKHELAPLSEADRARIDVIVQSNKGPGGARNTGLEAADDAEFAAFLDSDDAWAPDHLARAVNALTTAQADVFFANVSGDTDFDYHGQIADIAQKWDGALIDAADRVYEIEDLAHLMLRDWSYMHLSCLVLTPTVFRRVRFESDLRLAAEDVVFFYDCLRAARRTLLGAEAGAVRGRGVNIFHGVDGAADKYLAQQFCVWLAFDILDKRGGHTAETKDILAQRKTRARRHALWGQKARLNSGKAPQIAGIAKWLLRDPGLAGAAIGLAKGDARRAPANDFDLV